jgi:phosphoglycolate phosphatase
MTRCAILFDLDGTLVDSLPDLAAAVNALLAEEGRPPLPLPALAGMIGDGTAALLRRALAASGIEDAPFAPLLQRFLALYEAGAIRLTRPYPGVPEGLATLAAAGCRLGLCTNKPEHATRTVLQGLGLDRFFDAVIGGDTVGALKPDPAPLLAALARLEVPPTRAAMVGDHRNDIMAAKSTGAAAVLARYGYGSATLGDAAADAQIDRFADLPAALARLLPAVFGRFA